MDAEDSFASHVRDRSAALSRIAYLLGLRDRTVSAAGLLAMRPGGGTARLIQPEHVQIWDIDVAHDLLVDGRFGGPSPGPAAFPAARWLYWLVLTATTALAVLFVTVIRWRRTRRWRRVR